MTTDPGERRDLADERDSIEYQTVYAEVEAEMTERSFGFGFGSPLPQARNIHAEAMRRLKEKYESACG